MNLLIRRLRENRATATVGILLLALAVIIVCNLLNSPTDARLEAIRQKGYPTTLAELNDYYPAVIDSQNNARIYEKAFGLPSFANLADINWPDASRALSVRERRELAELVATNQVALALLHSANPSNRCRYSMDLNKLFSESMGGHHFKLIQGEKLLCAEALWQASNGDSQQAVASFRAGGVLADSEVGEPWLIGGIIRIACWTIMMRRLESVMARTQMTEEELTSLQGMIAEAERPEALLHVLAGERALGIAAFADPVSVLVDFHQSYNTTECLKADLAIGISKSMGIFQRDRTFYLDTLETSIAAASLPFPERLNLGLRVPGGVGPAPHFCSISGMVTPRISSVFVSEANMAARLRCAYVALGVERFRQHEGKLPASLQELTPGYCKALAVDPFDGKPLQFKVLDSGYAICSSGTDNGSHLEFRIIRPDDSSQP